MLKKNIIRLVNIVKSKKNFKNGIIFTFFSFLNQGMNFIVTMFLVTILTLNDFGNINLFNTLATILLILIPCGTTGYLTINYFNSEKKQIQEILSSIYIISTLSFILILVTSIIFSNKIELATGLTSKFQFFALLTCFFQSFTFITLDLWRLQEKAFKYGIYTTCVVLINVLLTLIFILYLELGWQGRVYALLLTNSTFFFISIFILLKQNLLKITIPKVALFKAILAFGIPIIPHLLTNWMRQGLDRYIINNFWDTSSVGIFSFAFNLANIILMIGTAFNASNSVYIYKSLSNINRDTFSIITKQIKLMSILFLTITIFILVTCYFLIPTFLPKYSNTIPLLFPACFGAFFQCIYLLFVNFLFYYKKTKELMYITVTVSIIHMLSSFLLTKYSIIYTAYIGLLSSFVICLLVTSFSLKYIKKLHENIS